MEQNNQRNGGKITGGQLNQIDYGKEKLCI